MGAERLIANAGFAHIWLCRLEQTRSLAGEAQVYVTELVMAAEVRQEMMKPDGELLTLYDEVIKELKGYVLDSK